MIVTASIGVFLGGIVRVFLSAYPGSVGWGYLHLVAVGLMALAALIDSMGPGGGDRSTTYQGHHPTTSEPLRFLDALKEAPPGVRWLLAAQVGGAGFYCVAPLVVVHALRVMQLESWFCGYFLTAFMVGATLGTFTVSKFRNQAPGLLGAAFSLLGLIGILSDPCRSMAAFLAICTTMGWALSVVALSGTAIALRFCGDDGCTVYLRLLQSTRSLSIVAAVSLGYALRSFAPMAPTVMTAVLVTGALFCTIRIAVAAPLPEYPPVVAKK
jgi:uncharacterized membrane protein